MGRKQLRQDMGRKQRRRKRKIKKLKLEIEMLLAMSDRVFEKLIAHADHDRIKQLIAEEGDKHGETICH